MKIYAISDTHFNHKMLIEKGYRPADFEATILDNISRLSGDLLIHCGDFSIGNDDLSVRMYMDAAQNFKHKVLVRGNHDSHSDNWWVERGFSFVCKSFANTYFGKRLIFTHIPMTKFGDIDHNIHGHLHGNQHRLDGELAERYSPGFHIDLAPEIHGYAPVNLEKLA